MVLEDATETAVEPRGAGGADAAAADAVASALTATTAEADDSQGASASGAARPQAPPADTWAEQTPDNGWMAPHSTHPLQQQLTFNDTFMASPQHTSLDVSVFDDGTSGYGGAPSLLDEPAAGDLDLALEGPVDRPGVGRIGGGGRNGPGLSGDGDGDGDDGNSDGGEGNSKRGGHKEDSKCTTTTATPSWSELKTKAGKERKRLPLACIACRRKKIRCSGEKPACKHCVRSRTPCVYKVTTRKAAPRTDYMAMLDKRMRRMEDRLVKVMHRIDDDDNGPPLPARSVVKPAIPGAPTPAATASASQANENGAGGGGSNDGGVGAGASTGAGTGAGTAAGGSSSSSATAKKRSAGEAFGPELNHWALASSASGLGNGTARSGNAPQEQESEETKLLKEGTDALPPLELQLHLADVYFEKIYGQAYHLLHRPSYMSKLKKGTLPPVLILSVCAVAARFSDHPAVATTTQNFLRGEEWASRARAIVTRRYEWPNITILTCLIILCLHEFGTCQGGRSWALGGQAIRMAYALQLHKDVDHDPLPSTHGAPLSFIDREIRRRTMWSCFLMDRLNSSGTDRPMFIKEESVKIQLPIKESHFLIDHPGPTENLAGEPVPPPPDIPIDNADLDLAAAAKDNMGVAAYMVRVIAVWGRVINYLNQGGKEMDPHPMWSPESGYARLAKEAEGLLSTLPPTLTYSIEHLHLHDNEGMANQFLFLHIAIQQSILFMNRFALSSPSGYNNHTAALQQQPNAVPKAFVTRAGAKAFAAANRISQLLQDAETYTVSAPFVGYCVFLSSTVHIFGIFCGNPAIEATSKANLTINVKFLSKMKRYWGMFHFMTENLREQYRSCADAARQGTLAQERTMAASPIFQYGDWFDRYPHGVSNSDFGDADAAYKNKAKTDDSVFEQKQELRRVSDIGFASPRAGTSPASANGGKKGGSASHSGRGAAASSSSRTPARRKSIAKKASHGSAVTPSPGKDTASDAQQTTTTAGNSDAPPSGESQGTMQPPPYLDFFGAQAGEPSDFGALALSQLNASADGLPAMGLGTFDGSQQQQQQQQLSFFPTDYLSLSLAQQMNGSLSQLDRQLVMNAYGESMDTTAVNVAGGALDGISWEESPGSSGGPGSGPGDQRSSGPGAGRGGGGGGGGPGNPRSSGVGGSRNLVSAASVQHAFAQPEREPTSAWFMPFNMEPPELGQDPSGLGGGLDPFASIFGGDGGGLRHAS